MSEGPSEQDRFYREARKSLRSLVALVVLVLVVYAVFFLEGPSGLTLWQSFRR